MLVLVVVVLVVLVVEDVVLDVVVLVEFAAVSGIFNAVEFKIEALDEYPLSWTIPLLPIETITIIVSTITNANFMVQDYLTNL